MAFVINHSLLCRSNLDYFCSEQLVGRKTIISRYEALENFISRFIDPKYKDFISYPVVDGSSIEFYGINWENDIPELFNELSQEDQIKYRQIIDETVCYYRNKIEELKNSGNTEVADYLCKAITFVDDEFLFCYDNKVVMGVWGMKKKTNFPPDTDVITVGYDRFLTIKFKSDDSCHLANTSSLKLKSGTSVSMDMFPEIIPNEGYGNPRWTPTDCPSKITENLTFTATCDKRKVTVSFDSDSTCRIEGNSSIELDWGSTLSSSDFPRVVPADGYENPTWSPSPINTRITEDICFTASCTLSRIEPIVTPPIIEDSNPVRQYTVYFNAGENGEVEGPTSMQCDEGTRLDLSSFPNVKPKDGFVFKGWDIPNGFEVNSDFTVNAVYEEEKNPWWKRFWLWLCGLFSGGCLKRLLWFLLILFLLFLFLFLLKNCIGCTELGSGCTNIGTDRTNRIIVTDPGDDALGENDGAWMRNDPNVGRGGIYNPENPYNPTPTPGEGEGHTPGLPSGTLPPEEGVLPPITEDPEPGNPAIIPNRLNILMENEDKSILDLAKAFKEKYPNEEYKVVYYDNVVKRMQIEIPKNIREQLKGEIPSAFAPDFELFVFDETLFESKYTPNDPAISDDNKNWYLKSVKAYEAWNITRGSEDIVVAIVDNGFNLGHPELKSKVVRPYNVWTHDNNVFPQTVDHGTHVAGTAIASADNGKGLCGIAPNCKFMPIQVGDNQGRMTITSVLDGILFALYQGADVVNVSLSGQFTSLSTFPESVQQDMIKNHFKEEERLWNEISRIAATHRSTIVVAAGNDNVLAGIEALQRPDNIIVVSAVDKNNKALNKAGFSNYGKYSKVSAPGVDIYSSYGRDGYETLQGTSMATPIVTGAVALMKSLNDTITTKRIMCILKSTGLAVNGNVGNMIQIDKALALVKSGADVDCAPQPSTGDVQILLSWNNLNDLDLSCSDPNGDMVWFRNKRVRSGGQLEIDMNVEYPDSRNPIENIYWPTGGAPSGTYNVYVRYFRQHVRDASSPYKVKVKYGAEEKEYEGTLNNPNDVVKICSFVLKDSNASANAGQDSPGDGATQRGDNGASQPGRVGSSDDNNSSALNDLEMEQRRLKQELDRVENEIRKLKNSRN